MLYLCKFSYESGVLQKGFLVRTKKKSKFKETRRFLETFVGILALELFKFHNEQKTKAI